MFHRVYLAGVALEAIKNEKTLAEESVSGHNHKIVNISIMKLPQKYLVTILSVVFFANLLQAQTPEGFTCQAVHSVDFGDGANHFTIEAASAGFGGEVELRLDASDGPVIGRTFFHHTGDSTYFLPYESDLNQTVIGVILIRL